MILFSVAYEYNSIDILPGGLEISMAKNGWMIQWYHNSVKLASGAFISVLWLENRRAAKATFL